MTVYQFLLLMSLKIIKCHVKRRNYLTSILLHCMFDSVRILKRIIDRRKISSNCDETVVVYREASPIVYMAVCSKWRPSYIVLHQISRSLWEMASIHLANICKHLLVHSPPPPPPPPLPSAPLLQHPPPFTTPTNTWRMRTRWAP